MLESELRLVELVGSGPEGFDVESQSLLGNIVVKIGSSS